MNGKALADELAKLIDECKALDKELPAQAAAGKIILFPRVLGSLELLIRRTGTDGALTAARHKLHEAVKDFSSLVFSIQHDIQNWKLGEKEQQKIGQSLRLVRLAAEELEVMLKERRAS
ncbi:hypothetical protein [Rhodanobacter sp. BL-MT-08]